MDLIVCVDDKMGMAFNKRRQSRDRVLCEDILRVTAGETVGMAERSAMLFDGMGGNIALGALPEDCPCYFLEFAAPSSLSVKPERILLYRWNRHYPADVRFDIDLQEYVLAETVEFPGSSHELITREVYVHE